jgi:hypothetical protein
MFETIEKESQSAGGGDTPQWLSSHPNPGTRTQYINKEAAALTIGTPADTSGFETIKTAFSTQPPAKTMADLAKEAKEGGGGNDTPQSVGTPGQPVPHPSAQYRDIKGGGLFTASVPSDWTNLNGKTEIKVIPLNGYGQLNGQTVFSHGIEFGITKAASRDLGESTKAFLQAVSQSNPELRLNGNPQSIKISQRSALATALTNPSPLGGQEHIGLYTMMLADNATLFYYLTVVPEKDDAAFQEAFKHVGQSIRITDGK